MDFSTVIKSLISSNGEVGIPGLGLLKKVNKPATYDAKEQLFHPPNYGYEFTEDNEVDETLFIKEYAKIHHVDEKTIETVLYAEKTIWKNKLNSQESSLHFDEFGTLTKTDGQYSFVETDDIVESFEPIKVKKTEHNSLKSKTKKTKSSSNGLGWWIVLLFIIALVAGYIFKKELTPYFNKTKDQVEHWIGNDKLSSKELEIKKRDSIFKKFQDVGIFDTINPLDSMRYAVIVHSVLDSTRAAIYVDSLREESPYFNSRVIPNSPTDTLKNLRISLAKFTTKEVADTFKEDAIESGFENAWILDLSDTIQTNEN